MRLIRAHALAPAARPVPAPARVDGAQRAPSAEQFLGDAPAAAPAAPGHAPARAPPRTPPAPAADAHAAAAPVRPPAHRAACARPRPRGGARGRGEWGRAARDTELAERAAAAAGGRGGRAVPGAGAGAGEPAVAADAAEAGGVGRGVQVQVTLAAALNISPRLASLGLWRGGQGSVLRFARVFVMVPGTFFVFLKLFHSKFHRRLSFPVLAALYPISVHPR